MEDVIDYPVSKRSVRKPNNSFNVTYTAPPSSNRIFGNLMVLANVTVCSVNLFFFQVHTENLSYFDGFGKDCLKGWNQYLVEEMSK